MFKTRLRTIVAGCAALAMSALLLTAAPRQAASTGASAYDRILVMPTSTAPAAAANAGNRPNGNGAQRLSRGQAPEPAPEQDLEPREPPPDAADTGVNEPPFQFPLPGQFPQAGQFPQGNPFQGAVGQPGLHGRGERGDVGGAGSGSGVVAVASSVTSWRPRSVRCERATDETMFAHARRAHT